MRILFMTLLTLCSWQTLAQTQQYTLNNGLKIIVKEDHRAPVAVSMVWYNVGSADEPGGITGVSHALEHLMFKGTNKFPLGVFSKTIANLGGQDNAFTNNDYTAYFEKVAASQLPVTFELEADRMENLLLDTNEFAKEIKVIREERRMRTDNNPQALTFERFLATAHLASPYQHPVIGWMTDLHRMTEADARVWYQRYYAPNNATLVVVGDVNPAEIHQLAERYFGKIGRHPDVARKPQTEPPTLGKKTVQVHTSAQLPMLMLGYTVPSLNSAKGEYANDPYVLEVIAGILDAGDSARFNKNIIRGSYIASGVDVYYNMYARYQTQFILFGTPSQNHSVTELKTSILAEIQQLQKELVSSEELQRIKTVVIAQKTFEKDSIFGQAMELGLLETIGLGWKTAENYTARINEITPTQIQQVAMRYFHDNYVTEAELIPLQQHEGKL